MNRLNRSAARISVILIECKSVTLAVQPVRSH